jgi:hypothetical protein
MVFAMGDILQKRRTLSMEYEPEFPDSWGTRVSTSKMQIPGNSEKEI